MKTPLESLTLNERESLALWYGSESHKALEKLAELSKTILMKEHVGQLDITQVRYLTGGIGSLNKLLKDVKDNYKSKNKEG